MIRLVFGSSHTCVLKELPTLPIKTHVDLFLCGHMELFREDGHDCEAKIEK